MTAALVVLPLAAQEPPGFRVQSRLVVVPVNVTDAKGRAVDGLETPDFVILDNGRPQKVVVDASTTGVAPVALVVAVQASGISTSALAKVRRIGAMIQPLVTGDRGCAAVLAFAARVRWIQDCTTDPDKLTRAFEGLTTGAEKTARLLDAAQEAIARLQAMRNTRRVLLLVSETRDRGSDAPLEEVAVAAQKAGVAIYAATFSAFATALIAKPSESSPTPVYRGPPPPSNEPGSPPGRERVPIPPPEQRVDILGGLGELARTGQANSTKVLAEATGGLTYPFTRQKALEQAIEKLGVELHSQYVLSFTPETLAAGYHRLEVRMARRQPAQVRIRARPGYWAME